MDIETMKIELLCYGVNCSQSIQKRISAINPYVGNDKSVHSSYFILNGTYGVNTPLYELYTQSSPYSIEEEGEQLVLCKTGERVCDVTFLTPPKWYEKHTSNGTRMYDVLHHHSQNILTLTHYSNCYYADSEKQCLFCSVGRSKTFQIADLKDRAVDIVETLGEALKENANYSLVLSEGVKNDRDRGADYFSYILQKISENDISIKTSVELAPPQDNSNIDFLYSNGATSVLMNLEFYDNDVRKFYCPGKSKIDRDRYFDALAYSVKVFGSGNVASVLIAGIESLNNTIKCARLLIDMGVLPIIIPFKPYDNCMLSAKNTTNPDDIGLIYSEISNYFENSGFGKVCKNACISCGACNVAYYKKG